MSVPNAFRDLSGAIDGEVVRDEPLARRTSYRIGGPAALSVTADTYAALLRTIEVLERERVSWVVLGRGTNVLVSDRGYRGCVVRLGKEFSRVSHEEGGQVSAGAAVRLPGLVRECQRRGLSGLEFCVGIPGTVGGAVSMDAGTRHEWIGRRVSSVVTLRPGHGLRRLSGDEVEWGYRSCSIPAGEIILEATFTLARSDPRLVAQEMDARLSRRAQRQPLGKPSCGSVFKSPPDHVAGQLIEGCGLKGYAVGGAQVSDLHANFVVNNGGATAGDVVAVMHKMHDEVLSRYGIDLVPEVKYLGFR